VSTAAIERRAIREATLLAPALALTASVAFLLARALPDIAGKPWQEDEAVAGLISAQPLGDVLHTVLLDRGGAPLHFLLAHAAFALDGSPRTLRWLSLVFALATIPLCYDLARRLAGPFAGLTAAALAATSQLLTVYGTFGRMYTLFAFASALALDLFVRALDRLSRGTLAAAATAALLLLVIHPFGLFLFAAELAVAVWRWRVRALPVALPAALVVLPYVRLPGRYDPEAGMSAPEATLRALGGSAGGWGIGLALLAAFAAIGLRTVPRRFAVLSVLAIAMPPVTLAVFANDRVSPRHLIFVLPIWTTLVAAGVAGVPLRLAVAVTTVAVAALAPTTIADPRTTTANVTTAAAWVREHVHRGDLLYPYSPVFLAALPQASVATALPREPVALERALSRTSGTHRTLVAIPNEDSWSVVVVPGPFTNVPGALAGLTPKLDGIGRVAALQLYATSTDGTSPHRSSRR
jgi:Dolichyl-phosphate-mannose-protein mannosyltransferase